MILGQRDAKVATHPNNDSPYRVWLGSDYRGYPVAYFEIDERQFSDYWISQVIQVQMVETTKESPEENLRCAKVVCIDKNLEGVFITFLDEVTQQLPTNHPIDALATAATTWRSLLQVAKKGISTGAETGLYGELKFLENLISHSGVQMINTWQREGHDIHDFTDSRVRVEVKTSAFQNRQSVSIHGLKQLEVPISSKLFLAVAEIEKHGQGETLQDVITQLHKVGVDSDLLASKLAKGGYVQGMIQVEQALKFSISSWRYWEITTEQPVLNVSAISSNTVAAISDVNYTLSLAALGDSHSEFNWTLFGSTNGKW